MLKPLSFFRILLALLMTAGLLAPLAPAVAAADVAWNVACPVSHFGADDPIVAPRLPGVSHMHAFYGNTSTNAFTTEQSLLAAPSTCKRGFSTADHSAYWIPTLYRKLPSGGTQLVNGDAKHPLQITTYYRGNGAAGQKVTPFPQGLRMIAGDHEAASPQSTKIVGWRCHSGPGANFSDLSPSIPTCATNQNLSGVIHFPSCWDGKNLDSADHKSHMAYPAGKNACPADHPVRLPAVTFDIGYPGVNGPGSQYEISSGIEAGGSPYTLHGDFFAAWNDQVQSALVNSCLNAGRKCTGIQLSQVNLSAATPGSGAVLASAKLPSTTLPATGATATLGAIGVAGTALALAANRRRRAALLHALRRPTPH